MGCPPPQYISQSLPHNLLPLAQVLLTCHISKLNHPLFKQIYNFRGLKASLGFHFPFEDSHVQVKLLNKMCVFFLPSICLMPVRAWEGRGKSFLSYTSCPSTYNSSMSPQPPQNKLKTHSNCLS